jgi:Flp pilus assembly protein TadG
MTRTKRRGSQAVELALAMPFLLVASGGAMDLGQFLYLSERVAAVAAEGARAGSVADLKKENAVALATAAAKTAWTATEIDGTLSVTASLVGNVPSQRVVVTASVATKPVFGFLHIIPSATTITRAVRVGTQD